VTRHRSWGVGVTEHEMTTLKIVLRAHVGGVASLADHLDHRARGGYRLQIDLK
jgi:hypothetical protein